MLVTKSAAPQSAFRILCIVRRRNGASQSPSLRAAADRSGTGRLRNVRQLRTRRHRDRATAFRHSYRCHAAANIERLAGHARNPRVSPLMLKTQSTRSFPWTRVNASTGGGASRNSISPSRSASLACRTSRKRAREGQRRVAVVFLHRYRQRLVQRRHRQPGRAGRETQDWAAAASHGIGVRQPSRPPV